MVSSSAMRSMVMMTWRPSFWARSAVSMNALSLYPLQRMQGFGVVLQGQGDQQLGLAARLDAQVEGPPVFDQLLDDVALLVDLDRVDAAVAALVLVLRDGLLEGAAELLDPGLQDVGEADQEGEVAGPGCGGRRPAP